MSSAPVSPRFSRIINPSIILIAITLLAFGLRVWRLDQVPPGWRDDELINSLVISQHALDGDLAVYYPDASGHEALYHLLNAIMLGLFGPGLAGIRFLSVFLGTATVPLTYLVSKRLFGWKVGLLASIALTFGFWALMYSRIGIRHISLPVFMLAAFYFFLRGLEINNSADHIEKKTGQSRLDSFGLAGIALGIGFYTYFASRGVPVILLGVLGYAFLFHRSILNRRVKGLLLMFGLALSLALPLLITLYQQPESEARVEELAVPLVEAQTGNFGPLAEHIFKTIGMFHAGGDEEWLYNIPFRPVFGPVAAGLFWLGIGIALWYAFKPILRLVGGLFGKKTPPGILSATPGLEIAGAFLLIWWLVGISPGFVSVPPASLGHTIIALPVTYILAALPIFCLEQVGRLPVKSRLAHGFLQALPYIAAFGLIASIAIRDLPDYFYRWPERGMTRFLYRADLSELADYLNEHPELTDIGVTGLLAGPWDKLALAIELDDHTGAQPRWFNPERAALLRLGGEAAQVFAGYPVTGGLDEVYYLPMPNETAGGYQLKVLSAEPGLAGQQSCFVNGLCLVSAAYNPETSIFELIWDLPSELDLPESPLISNPPPPGSDPRPRLLVFAHLLDDSNQLISADDGLWVDPETLRVGDRFLQQHHFAPSQSGKPATIAFGLYDPQTGARILTLDGQDQLEVAIGSL